MSLRANGSPKSVKENATSASNSPQETETESGTETNINKMNIMANTPSSERLHIAVIGKRNSGKSSLVNMLTGQETSLVSETPGTTTDPVTKAMEMPGTGACLLIDTAGFDDEGVLGTMRVEKTRKTLEKADLAIMIFRDCDDQEAEWLRFLKEKGTPVIPVLNSGAAATACSMSGLTDNVTGTSYTGAADSAAGADAEPDAGTTAAETDAGTAAEWIRSVAGEAPVRINAGSGEGRKRMIEAIRAKAAGLSPEMEITGDLAHEGDCVVLVMPQDSQAPKGRLILPQVQTIRELLDKGCQTICCTPSALGAALERLKTAPDLIITDSQAFDQVWKMRPHGCRVTSFSILFAGYKGDMKAFLQGAEALGRLTEKSRVLIAEACTHAPAGEDIGRVKIPGMLRRRFGEGIGIDIVSGPDFLSDLSGYDLVIHCGACMFNRAHVLSRIAAAARQGVPITNYGMTIAWAGGILDKVAIPARQ